jgi:hypothetical protein
MPKMLWTHGMNTPIIVPSLGASGWNNKINNGKISKLKSKLSNAIQHTGYNLQPPYFFCIHRNRLYWTANMKDTGLNCRDKSSSDEELLICVWGRGSAYQVRWEVCCESESHESWSLNPECMTSMKGNTTCKYV